MGGEGQVGCGVGRRWETKRVRACDDGVDGVFWGLGEEAGGRAGGVKVLVGRGG